MTSVSNKHIGQTKAVLKLCMQKSQSVRVCGQNSLKKCGKRHHTSICDSNGESDNGDVVMTTGEKSEGIFPIVVVELNGVRCKTLIDSGAGSSNTSAKLINLLKS